MVDVLVSAFGGPAPKGTLWKDHVEEWKVKLDNMFDKHSLETVYGFIVRRDFTLTDIMDTFASRFTSMFGGTPKDRPQTTQ